MANLSRIGKYLIRRELGKGAMGVVYEGFDPVLERIVAIKTILPKQLDSEHSADVLARFKREGPTAEEMTKATAGAEFVFVSALENSLAKAEILNKGSVYHGDAGYYKKEYAGIKAVTAADVK